MSDERQADVLEPDNVELHFEFESNVQTSLAAAALVSGRPRLNGALTAGALCFAAASSAAWTFGWPVGLLGMLVVLVGLFFVQIDPISRRQYNRYYSSLYGQ